MTDHSLKIWEPIPASTKADELAKRRRLHIAGYTVQIPPKHVRIERGGDVVFDLRPLQKALGVLIEDEKART